MESYTICLQVILNIVKLIDMHFILSNIFLDEYVVLNVKSTKTFHLSILYTKDFIILRVGVFPIHLLVVIHLNPLLEEVLA